MKKLNLQEGAGFLTALSRVKREFGYNVKGLEKLTQRIVLRIHRQLGVERKEKEKSDPSYLPDQVIFKCPNCVPPCFLSLNKALLEQEATPKICPFNPKKSNWKKMS